MFRLAMVQMFVEGGQKQRNLARAGDLIARAADTGAQVVLLPEAMDCGWTHPCASDLASAIPGGDACTALAESARRHGVYVCAGLVERDGASVYNSAVLLDPRGELLLHHRKLNELEIGWPYYAPGDRLGVARTPLGTFGLMICADAFARGHPVQRTLGLMGAQVILSPSAWAVPADHDQIRNPYGRVWRDAYRPVANEFGMWILGCSNVGPVCAGPWEGRRCIGCSLVVNPRGEVALQAPYGVEAETIIPIDIEPVVGRRFHLGYDSRTAVSDR